MNPIEVGKRIKYARTNKNLTLDDIATKIGVAKSTVQRYEAGKIKSLKLPVLDSIAYAIGVNPAWLCGKSENMILTNNANDLFELSELEKQLVINFRKADEFDKAIVLRTLKLEQSHTEARAGANDKLA